MAVAAATPLMQCFPFEDIPGPGSEGNGVRGRSAQTGERVMRPEVRAGAGSRAPLGRLWVGEGRQAGEGVGWSQPQRLGGVGDSRMWAGASRHSAQQVGAPGPLPAAWCPYGLAQTH